MLKLLPSFHLAHENSLEIYFIPGLSSFWSRWGKQHCLLSYIKYWLNYRFFIKSALIWGPIFSNSVNQWGHLCYRNFISNGILFQMELSTPARRIKHPDQISSGYINSTVPAGKSHSWWDYSDFLDLGDACRKSLSWVTGKPDSPGREGGGEIKNRMELISIV